MKLPNLMLSSLVYSLISSTLFSVKTFAVIEVTNQTQDGQIDPKNMYFYQVDSADSNNNFNIYNKPRRKPFRIITKPSAANNATNVSGYPNSNVGAGNYGSSIGLMSGVGVTNNGRGPEHDPSSPRAALPNLNLLKSLSTPSTQERGSAYGANGTVASGGMLSNNGLNSNSKSSKKKSLEYMYKLKTDLYCPTRSTNYSYKDGLFEGVTKRELKDFPDFDKKHLKYFGYYASAMEGAGQGDYVTETHQKMNANITMIASNNLEYIKAKLILAKSLKMKVILSNQSFLFDEKYNVRNDLTDWGKLSNLIQEYIVGEDPTIVAFYPMDEPYSNAEYRGVDNQFMKNSLEKAGDIMKSYFPKTPLAVIFAASEIYKGDFSLPRNYDWFSFDLYGCWSSGQCKYGIKETYEVLGDKVAQLSDAESQKKLFVVADSYSASNRPDVYVQEGIKERAIHYFRLAQSNECFVMYMPFIYQSFPDGGGFISGSNNMPRVAEEYTKQGRYWLKNLTGEFDIFEKTAGDIEAQKAESESNSNAVTDNGTVTEGNNGGNGNAGKNSAK